MLHTLPLLRSRAAERAARRSFGRPTSSRTQKVRVAELLRVGASCRLGATVKSRRTVHQKAALFDDSYAVFGSGNWTRNSNEHCYELAVATADPGAVAAVASKFQKLWSAATLYTYAQAEEDLAKKGEEEKAKPAGPSVPSTQPVATTQRSATQP